MVIVECIFKGFVIQCNCGESFHVAFSAITKDKCGCGQSCAPIFAASNKAVLERAIATNNYVS